MLARLAYLFQALLAPFRRKPDRGGKPRNTHERRKWERHNSQAQIALAPALPEPKITRKARVQDVSRGGICLVGEWPCAKGDLLHLTIPDLVESQATELLACVVRVTAGVSNTWSVGCTFIRELSSQEIRAFL